MGPLYNLGHSKLDAGHGNPSVSAGNESFRAGLELVASFINGKIEPFIGMIEDSDSLYALKTHNSFMYERLLSLVYRYANLPHDLTLSLAAACGCEDAILKWVDTGGVTLHSALICASNGLVLDANGVRKQGTVTRHLEHVFGGPVKAVSSRMSDLMQHSDIDVNTMARVLSEFSELADFMNNHIDTLCHRTEPDEPTVMSLAEFLCHADGPDPWCKQHFDDYINDIDIEWDPDEVQLLKDGYFLAPSSDSMLLLRKEGEGAEVVGYYNTPGAVCIKDEHQGKGLGAELVLATFEWCGAPPTEGLDEQSFSKAGFEAHKAAYRLGVKRGLILRPGRTVDLCPQP